MGTVRTRFYEQSESAISTTPSPFCEPCKIMLLLNQTLHWSSNETGERYFPEYSGKKLLTKHHIVIQGKLSLCTPNLCK